MNGNNPLPIVISEPQKTAIAQYTGIVDDNVKAIVSGHNFIDNQVGVFNTGMNSHGITTTALDLINHGGGAFGRGFALTMNGAANVVDNDGCSTLTKFKRVLLHNCQRINSSMFLLNNHQPCRVH